MSAYTHKLFRCEPCSLLKRECLLAFANSKNAVNLANVLHQSEEEEAYEAKFEGISRTRQKKKLLFSSKKVCMCLSIDDSGCDN